MQNLHSAMTRRQLTMVFTALLTFGLTGSLVAQPGAWEHLGTKEIEGKADHDKIRCHGSETYKALQFRVNGAAVQFDRVVVEYGNHKTRAYPFRILVPPNGRAPCSTSLVAIATSPTWSSGTRRRRGDRSPK